VSPTCRDNRISRIRGNHPNLAHRLGDPVTGAHQFWNFSEVNCVPRTLISPGPSILSCPSLCESRMPRNAGADSRTDGVKDDGVLVEVAGLPGHPQSRGA
jgi:hypothetical protein